jgi:UDP-3-O-[3-hydroxymyristoyl] glucosamine N-acyltransferase
MKSFDRCCFFPIKKRFDSNDIVPLIDNYVQKFDIFESFQIHELSSNLFFRDNSILFLDKNVRNEYSLKQNILIITNDSDFYKKKNCSNYIIVNDIQKCYQIILNNIFFHEDDITFNDEFDFINNSYISKFSKIDSSSKIGNGCTIGRGVIIGKNCIIKNNVVIKNSILSDDITISDNSTLGSTGFGFDLINLGSKNLNPQLGIVYIDDGVYIGSNCSIDRAKIDCTYIGKNSMLDNLIHIAHNVTIGNNACIAGQVGIAGSTNIGNNIMIGGQAGISGHLTIGDNVKIGAKSGVIKNINDNMVVAGFPATNIKDWKRSIILNRKKNVRYK